MMASIRTRSETNRLFIDFRFRGVRYRQQTTLKNTESNLLVLKKEMKKIEAEIELGVLNIDELFPRTKRANRVSLAKLNDLIVFQKNGSKEGVLNGGNPISSRPKRL